MSLERSIINYGDPWPFFFESLLFPCGHSDRLPCIHITQNHMSFWLLISLSFPFLANLFSDPFSYLHDGLSKSPHVSGSSTFYITHTQRSTFPWISVSIEYNYQRMTGLDIIVDEDENTLFQDHSVCISAAWDWVEDLGPLKSPHPSSYIPLLYRCSVIIFHIWILII